MANYVHIDTRIHAGARWKRPSSYAFASGDSIVPLTIQELSRAVMAFPIAFSRLENGFQPVAMLGFESGSNLFVAHDGSWKGSYVPAMLRTYPFRLGSAQDGTRVLCIDAESGLMGNEGELLLNEDGSPAQEVARVMQLLNQIEAERMMTLEACSVLEKSGLIVPWEITLQEEGGNRKLAGLYKIDEAAMNALEDGDYLDLRKKGALPMAYCQLLSMQNLQILGRLRQAPPPKATVDPLAFLMSQGENISFSGLI